MGHIQPKINGRTVPSVTQIAKAIAFSPHVLQRWAWKLGRDGLDLDDESGDNMETGTLVHDWIDAVLTGKQRRSAAWFTPRLRHAAELSFACWTDWLSRQDRFEVLETEWHQTSEKGMYGGTCDLVALIGGRLTIIDWKTAKGIYPEYKLQLAGYGGLWDETHPDRPVEQYRVVCLPKTGKKAVEAVYTPEQIRPAQRLFVLARSALDLRREVEGL